MKSFHAKDYEEVELQDDSLRITASNHEEAGLMRKFFVDVLGGVPIDEPYKSSNPTLTATREAEALFCPHVAPGEYDVFIRFNKFSDAERFFDVATGPGLRPTTFKM